MRLERSMLVVALCLEDADGRLLLARRPVSKHHGGLWEFPGGKVEPGETPRVALAREVAEELAIRIDPAALSRLTFAEDDRLVLLLFGARTAEGQVTGMEGQEWGWFTWEAATQLPLAPLDRQMLQKLA